MILRQVLQLIILMARALTFIRQVYRELANGAELALPLHRTVRRAREAARAYPQQWAPHLHFGP